MRIALLSDIHGNADALGAVLRDARTEGAERIVCCGDIVGYYYAPDTCLDLLSEWTVDCVRGNHEDMLATILAEPAAGVAIQRKYGSGLAVALEVLSPARLDYLTGLPTKLSLSLGGKTILLSHGAPWDSAYYVYPDASAEVIHRCAEGEEDYVVLGHTHYPLAIQSGVTLVVNPGSVGQARGVGRGLAHWSCLDLDSGEYHHKATAYPTARLIAEIERRDPDVAYLRTILDRNEVA